MLNKTLILGILFTFLVGCQNVSSPNPIDKEETPISDNEISLFDDSDIENANAISTKSPRLIEPTDLGEIADGTNLPDLPNIEVSSENELTSQALVEGAIGMAYYVLSDPSLSNPYQVYKHNQITNQRTLVYKGQLEIQSVAGDLSGNIIILSMRSYQGGTFQIYRLNLLNDTVQQLTSTFLVNKINVSVSRNGKVIAHQFQYNGNDTAGVYKFESVTSNGYEYTGFTNYRDPSISADGRYLVLQLEI